MMRNYGIVNLVTGGVVLAGFIVYLVCGIALVRYELIGLSFCWLAVYLSFNLFINEKKIPLHGAFAGGIYGSFISNHMRDEIFYRGNHTEEEIVEYENTPVKMSKNAASVSSFEIVMAIVLIVFGILWAVQESEGLIWPWILVLSLVGVADGVVSIILNHRISKILDKSW